MTATNHIGVVKDGAGTTVTGGWSDVSESTSGAKASAVYLKNTDESLVAAPMQATGGVVGITGTVPLPTGASTAAKQAALGTAGTPSADVLSVQGVAAGTPLATSVIITNPTSVLTRPANTTAYAQFDLVSSNVTAGSIVVPSFTATRLAAGNTMIRALRMVTNVTTGWNLITLGIDLWTTAPTFTNGDNGAYAVATGAAGWVGNYQITLTQFGDGAVGRAAIANSYELGLALGSGQLAYWSAQIMTIAAATPISGQTFTLTAEDYQN